MDKGRRELFNQYCNSIFNFSNKFSQAEYDKFLKQYELNYGCFIRAEQNIKVLDVGCGAGHFLYYLEKKGISNYLGIDISPQQIEFCKANISSKVKLADAEEFLQVRKRE